MFSKCSWLGHQMLAIGVCHATNYPYGTSQADVALGVLPDGHQTRVLRQCRRCDLIETVTLNGHWTLEQVTASTQVKELEKMFK